MYNFIKSITIRIQKIIASKRGMSLLEVLVVCVLFALIAAMATAVISPMLKAYARANEIAEYNMILDNVGNTLVNNIAQASVIESFEDDSVSMIVGSSMLIFDIYDGSLQKNGRKVFSQNFYKGKSISFTITPTLDESSYLVDVTVTSDSTGVAISRSYAVRPLMMIDS